MGGHCTKYFVSFMLQPYRVHVDEPAHPLCRVLVPIEAIEQIQLIVDD